MPDTLTSTSTAHPSGNRAAVQRYRSRNKRIDYVPGSAALAIIEGWRAKGLSNCAAGVIDALILEGDKKMSGHSTKAPASDIS